MLTRPQHIGAVRWGVAAMFIPASFAEAFPLLLVSLVCWVSCRAALPPHPPPAACRGAVQRGARDCGIVWFAGMHLGQAP